MAKVLQLQTPEWAVPLMNPSRYKGAWGGRGSGKSHFLAYLAQRLKSGSMGGASPAVFAISLLNFRGELPLEEREGARGDHPTELLCVH